MQTSRSYQIAEIKLSYKNKPDISSRPKITQSKEAYAVLLHEWDEEQIGFVEEFKVLLLNRANAVLGIYHLAVGGVTGVVVDAKLVFAAALKANACNLILAHNHPSENVTPSRADKVLTDKIKQAGETMDITVLDHLIISPHSYYSFTDDATYYRKDLGIDREKKEIPQTKENTMAAEAQSLSVPTNKTVTASSLQKEFIDLALIRSSLAYDALLASWQDNTLDMMQSFKMLSLDKDCRPICLHSFPQDVKLDTPQDARLLLSLAAKDNASFIVLAQNKRYGVILPKIADLDFAEMLNVQGKDHDITLLDYLFVNQGGYYSYNDNEFHLASQLQPG